MVHCLPARPFVVDGHQTYLRDAGRDGQLVLNIPGGTPEAEWMCAFPDRDVRHIFRELTTVRKVHGEG